MAGTVEQFGLWRGVRWTAGSISIIPTAVELANRLRLLSSCAAPFQAFLSGPQAHALGGNLYEFEPMTFLASYSPRGPKVGPIRRCAAMDASFFYSIKKEGDSRIFQAQDRAIDDFTLKGSAGGNASPACSSSMEMPSGVRMKAIRPSRGGRLIVMPRAMKALQVS